jgi:hypothetical protein
MKCKASALSIVSVLALVLVLILASESLAKATTVKGSGSATFISNSTFSYDGTPGDASVNTGSAKDNLGGQYTFQSVAEYGAATATTCTAPDGTAGLQYDLVASNTVVTYNSGQAYSSAVPSSSNKQCLSNTTGSFSGTTTYTVNGGTGKFATASGSVTITFTGTTLAAPGTPPGAGGFFGADQFTETGSVTK